MFAAFGEAGAAVAAAVAAQRSLQAHDWPEDATIRVRMGVHSGEAHRAGDDYGGIEVSRAARVAAVGHGGQIVLSGPTYELTADDLPAGTTARDLGLFVLKDVPRPERLYQLDVPGLPAEFPPVRAGRTTVGNLEPRLTTFVGRDDQVEALRALLDDARLVTITGAGGSARRASPRRRPAPSRPSTPTGRGSCRSRRSRTRPTSRRWSPGRSACSTARRDPRSRRCPRSLPSARCCSSWTTSSTSSTPPRPSASSSACRPDRGSSSRAAPRCG